MLRDSDMCCAVALGILHRRRLSRADESAVVVAIGAVQEKQIQT